MIYKIAVTETRQKVIDVEAENVGEAVTKVAEDYGDGWIRLVDNDFVGFEIKEYKEQGNGG